MYDRVSHQQVQQGVTDMPCFFPQVAEQREGQLVGGGTHEGGGAYEAAEAVREDPRVSSVLERLTQVESRVGTQLEQLVKLQQQQVPYLSVCAVYAVCLVCLSVGLFLCLSFGLSVRLPAAILPFYQTIMRIAEEKCIKLSLGCLYCIGKIVLTWA